MLDACIVAPGGFPRVTGGLSRWVEVVCLALSKLDLGVWSIGQPACLGLEHSIPKSIRVLKHQRVLAGAPPTARLYIVCGPLIAEWAKEHHELLGRTIYVEHGDQARELAVGAWRCEAGNELHPRAVHQLLSDRDEAALACQAIVGVHRRTARRLRQRTERRLLTIPNAVPPVTQHRKRSKRVSFIGRACRAKGIDRWEKLQRRLSDVELHAQGLHDAASPELLRNLETRFAGPQKDPWQELPGLIVMPSRSEGSPFVALEAEARGVPVLITPGAELGSSSLINEAPWDSEWMSHVRRTLNKDFDVEEGTRLARCRWRNFTATWNCLLQTLNAKGEIL